MVDGSEVRLKFSIVMRTAGIFKDACDLLMLVNY